MSKVRNRFILITSDKQTRNALTNLETKSGLVGSLVLLFLMHRNSSIA